ncbi:MAG: hypothetical protein JXB85_01205 [Anaerolineales bacterium]|nr:hypothetical protein [Anaerolineales bacterium]
MTASSKDTLKLFSLGLEELSLALGMINCPELGRDVLAAIYPEADQQEVDIRLSTASHSMLARGLCTISAAGAPVLDPILEQALFPLARYDRLLQVSLVRPAGQIGATIHTQKRRGFTSHTIQSGVIHILESGPLEALPGFLENVFAEMGHGGQSARIKARITPALLGEATSRGQNQAQVKQSLVDAGWKAAEAGQLAEDVVGQTLRATILRLETKHSDTIEDVQKSTKPMLLLLKGQQRTWAFEFPSADDSAQGSIQLLDRKALETLLKSFVA